MKIILTLMLLAVSVSVHSEVEIRADLVDYSELISGRITVEQYVNYCEVNKMTESAEDICHEYYVNEAYKDGVYTKQRALELLGESSE